MTKQFTYKPSSFSTSKDTVTIDRVLLADLLRLAERSAHPHYKSGCAWTVMALNEASRILNKATSAKVGRDEHPGIRVPG